MGFPFGTGAGSAGGGPRVNIDPQCRGTGPNKKAVKRFVATALKTEEPRRLVSRRFSKTIFQIVSTPRADR